MIPPADSTTTRRFYWEVVRLRSTEIRTDASALGSACAASVLADARLAPGLAALRNAAGRAPVRVACVVELHDDAAGGTLVTPILEARDALARHDIALDLWPQLAEGDGRFLNTSTATTFQQRLLPLLDLLAGETDIGLALDIEPREHLVRAAWRLRDPASSLWKRARAVGGLVTGLGRAVVDARQGRRDLTELARDLKARALPVHVSVLPPLASTRAQFPGGRDTWRTWALGCPVVDDDGQPLFGLQAAMCYAPLARRLPGNGRVSSWDREREKSTLALWAARHRASFDAVVVGQTATGILGDEPVYEDPALLAEDVRAMDALGFTDVAVYALEGLLFGPTGAPPPDATSSLPLRANLDTWLAASFGLAPGAATALSREPVLHGARGLAPMPIT